MNREIRYHRKVPEEVREIIAYYAKISDKLADDFWNEFYEAIELVQRFPERHHFEPSGRRRCNLNRFPYHFLFRASPERIRVIVVGITPEVPVTAADENSWNEQENPAEQIRQFAEWKANRKPR